MTRAALLSAVFLVVAGCSTTRDPHAPRTITARADGGSVTLSHGQRLRIPLAGDGNAELEWRRVEPPVMTVVAEGAPDAQGFNFTPVRTGSEKLRFEYRPVTGEGAAQKVVSYDVTVR
jgi:hypothetical protein